MSTQAQQLLDAAFNGNLNLDADASEAFGASTAVTETTSATTTAETAAPAQDEQAGAPIASKSGGYVIPYEKLSEARTERDQLKLQRDQLLVQVEQLTTAQAANLAQAHQDAQGRADAGQAPNAADQNLATAQTLVEQGVDPALFGDFSEEGIARGVDLLVEQRITARVSAEVQKKMDEMLAPQRAADQAAAGQQHVAQIMSAHPDASEIYESQEFADWKAAQPSYVRSGLEQALTTGAASDVIEVFSQFKQAFGAGNANTAADAVSVALRNAKSQPPISLSDLPGAPAGSSTEAQRAAAMAADPAALLDYVMGLPADRQNRILNSVV